MPSSLLQPSKEYSLSTKNKISSLTRKGPLLWLRAPESYWTFYQPSFSLNMERGRLSVQLAHWWFQAAWLALHPGAVSASDPNSCQRTTRLALGASICHARLFPSHNWFLESFVQGGLLLFAPKISGTLSSVAGWTRGEAKYGMGLPLDARGACPEPERSEWGSSRCAGCPLCY